MLAQSPHRRYPYDATPDEMRALFSERLRALEDATRRATWGSPLPVTWRMGWSAKLEIVGRSRDHSLLGRITCTGPGLSRPYVRSVRMVNAHRLPSSSGLQ